MPLTSILAAWEKCAKEATPGPWCHVPAKNGSKDILVGPGEKYTGKDIGHVGRDDWDDPFPAYSLTDAAFIAHFHPARVLLMIEAIRCAEKLAEAGREYTKTREYQNVSACKEDQDRLEGILIAQIHALDAALQRIGESK